MFEKEADFRDFVKEKLEEQGFEVHSEVTIYQRKRVDLVAKKEAPEAYGFMMIETKLENHGKMFDALSYVRELQKFPNITHVCIAVPLIHLKKDFIEYAKGLGVGVIGVTEEKIEWHVRPSTLPQLELGIGFSRPTKVSPGEVFEIRFSITANHKIATNICAMYTPSGPLRRPPGEKNRKCIEELKPEEQKDIILKVKVRSDTKPAKYPLFTKIASDGYEKSSVYDIEVKNDGV